MKPVMNKREDIEEIVNSAAERAAKKVLETTVDTGVGTEGKKLSQVLKDIKNKPPEDKDKNEDVHKHEDDIDCPTCHTGHVHKLKEKDGILKCTGPGCDAEYRLISADPDFYCTNCNTPVKIPSTKELENKYSCPTCGKDKFKELDKYDKRRIKKIKS